MALTAAQNDGQARTWRCSATDVGDRPSEFSSVSVKSQAWKRMSSYEKWQVVHKVRSENAGTFELTDEVKLKMLDEVSGFADYLKKWGYSPRRGG